MRCDIAHVALAVHREHDAPAIGRERDRALLGGALRKAEARAVGGDDLTHRGHPLAMLPRFAEELVEISLEVAGRRVVPRCEFEVRRGHLEDLAERRDGRLVGEHRDDDATFVQPERAFALRRPERQLAGLLLVAEEANEDIEREFRGRSLQAPRGAPSVCLSKMWILRMSQPPRTVAPGFVWVSVDTRAMKLWPPAESSSCSSFPRNSTTSTFVSTGT